MNANRNLKIDFRINKYRGKKFVTDLHDHFINDPQNRHVQPHQPKRYATKPWKATHPKSEE